MLTQVQQILRPSNRTLSRRSHEPVRSGKQAQDPQSSRRLAGSGLSRPGPVVSPCTDGKADAVDGIDRLQVCLIGQILNKFFRWPRIFIDLSCFIRLLFSIVFRPPYQSFSFGSSASVSPSPTRLNAREEQNDKDARKYQHVRRCKQICLRI